MLSAYLSGHGSMINGNADTKAGPVGQAAAVRAVFARAGGRVDGL